MAELKYEIVKECGVLSQSPTGWTKELNLISWNDRAPKYDIRDWLPTAPRWARVSPSPPTRSSCCATCSTSWICNLQDVKNTESTARCFSSAHFYARSE